MRVRILPALFLVTAQIISVPTFAAKAKKKKETAKPAEVIKATKVAFYPDREGRCLIEVYYGDPSAVGWRALTVEEVAYMSKQPGNLQRLATVKPGMDKAWVDRLTESNQKNSLGSVPLHATAGSNGCDSLRELANSLDQRIQAGKSPAVDDVSLMVGALKGATLPAYSRTKVDTGDDENVLVIGEPGQGDAEN